MRQLYACFLHVELGFAVPKTMKGVSAAGLASSSLLRVPQLFEILSCMMVFIAVSNKLSCPVNSK